MATLPQALTIASSDSGGGAGIQADIKAMHANGAYGLSAIVALTAQNTRTVTAIYPLPLDFIRAQIEAVFDDFEIGSVKTGMLYSSEIVGLVSEILRRRNVENLVVDPVMISKGGSVLLKDDAIDRLMTDLFPLATIVTPNVHEAERIAGRTIRSLDDAREAARRIHKLGARTVVIKGGHLSADPATDLFYDGTEFSAFRGEWIKTQNTHGTGCTFSAAIAANLAKGVSPADSVGAAKRYITEAIRHGLSIGHGHGPTNHFYFIPEDSF